MFSGSRLARCFSHSCIRVCVCALRLRVFADWHVCPRVRVFFSARWCVDVGVFALCLQRCADVHRVRRAGLFVCLACTLMCVCLLKKNADLHFVNTLGQSAVGCACVCVTSHCTYKERCVRVRRAPTFCARLDGHAARRSWICCVRVWCLAIS